MGNSGCYRRQHTNSSCNSEEIFAEISFVDNFPTFPVSKIGSREISENEENSELNYVRQRGQVILGDFHMEPHCGPPPGWTPLLPTCCCKQKAKCHLSQMLNVEKQANTSWKGAYEIISHLGQGSYGDIKKIRNKLTGEYRALKIIKKHMNCEKLCTQEMEILRSLSHPNIIRYYEHFMDNSNHYIIMELCEGGELLESILDNKYLSETECKNIMKQLLAAVAHIHQKHIIHGDLKLENILLCEKGGEKEIKIIDFGCSSRFKVKQMFIQQLGTPIYSAPEILRGQNSTTSSDIWSCGVIMYLLLFVEHPFQSISKAKLGHFSFPEKREISTETKEFVKKLLEIDYTKRISGEEALYDTFFQ